MKIKGRKRGKLNRKLIGLLLGLFSPVILSMPSSIELTVPIIAQDPKPIQGGRIAYQFYPEAFKKKHLRIFFSASVGQWHAPGRDYRHLTILTVAPVLRYERRLNTNVSPYIEASIGPSYLSKTRFEKRHLGIHFSFQDYIALGAILGKNQHFSASISTMHYSNGGFSKKNSGITIPLLFNIAYRFT